MKMDDVTVGTKSFYRPEKIRQCLESIAQTDLEFKQVIVADDGDITEEKEEIYEEYQEKLPLEVIDLEFDYGLGGSRNKVHDKMDGEYLLWVDDDMMIPRNVTVMKRILEKREELGGISGIMLEEGEFRAEAHQFKLRETPLGTTLVKDIFEERKEEVNTDTGPKTLFKFDLVLNCLMLKKACLDEAKWDDHYIIQGEHTDFFLNHYFNTD